MFATRRNISIEDELPLLATNDKRRPIDCDKRLGSPAIQKGEHFRHLGNRVPKLSDLCKSRVDLVRPSGLGLQKTVDHQFTDNTKILTDRCSDELHVIRAPGS